MKIWYFERTIPLTYGLHIKTITIHLGMEALLRKEINYGATSDFEIHILWFFKKLKFQNRAIIGKAHYHFYSGLLLTLGNSTFGAQNENFDKFFNTNIPPN